VLGCEKKNLCIQAIAKAVSLFNVCLPAIYLIAPANYPYYELPVLAFHNYE